MNSQEQGKIIEVSLLKWVSLLTGKKQLSFHELSTGEFYINILSQVRQFKFIKPLKDIVQNDHHQQNFNLVNRISNIKIIGESVLRYYQTRLMKDVSGVKVNYVQLCMGNRAESIKLFSLVIGIVGQTQSSQGYKKLLQTIQNLQPEDQDIVKALLENSCNIGEQINKKQDSPIQKRMLTKLQIYEDKIQNLELQLQSLRQLHEQEKLNTKSYQKEIKELKLQKTKLIQKVQVFQLLNTSLESQNSKIMLQNQNLIKKLQSQKRNYETILDKNQQTIQNHQRQISVVNLMKQKIQELKSANKELKESLSEVIKEQQQKQTMYNMMKENYKKVQENYVKTQQKLTQVEIQYQNYKFQRQKSPQVKGTVKLLSSPPYHISNNSILSSLNYRVRDRLGSFIRGQLSQVQMVDSNIAQRLRDTSNSKGSSMNKINAQYLLSSHLQNFSHFSRNQIRNGNLQDIEDVSQFDGQYSYEGSKVHEFQLDKSIIIDQQEEVQLRNQSQKKKSKQSQKSKTVLQCNNCDQISCIDKPIEDQIQLLVLMVEKLFSQNQNLKSQLQSYQSLKAKKQHRVDIFKQKLTEIRKIEPISEIDAKFQQQKENLNQNGFPFSLKTQKLNENSRNKIKKSVKDPSQISSIYPFIPN